MIFPKHGMKEGIHMAKSKLTKEIIEQLADDHSKGLPIKHCCAFAGISKSSYYNWMKKGEEENKSNNGLYIELYEAMNKARAYAIQHYVRKIFEDPKPQTLIFMLRVLDPDTFNISHKVDSTQQSYHRLEKLFDKKRIEQLTEDKEE